MTIEKLATEKAPGAVGPYSQGTATDSLVFTSGQLPMDPVTGELSTGDIGKETKLCLENVKAVLQAAGSDLDKILKVTVFVTDIGDFDAINAVYAEYFTSHKPARSLVQVAKLPKGANIEIEAIAVR